MHKKIWLLTAILLIFIAIFAGCSKKDEGEVFPETTPPMTDESDELIRETIVYYEDDAGYLVPVMRKIPWVEGIAKYTLPYHDGYPGTTGGFIDDGAAAIASC